MTEKEQAMPLQNWMAKYPGVQALFQHNDDILLYGEEDGRELAATHASNGRPQNMLVEWHNVPTWHGPTIVYAARIGGLRIEPLYHADPYERSVLQGYSCTWTLAPQGEATALCVTRPRFTIGKYLVIADDMTYRIIEAKAFERDYVPCRIV